MKVRLPKGVGGGPQDMNSMFKKAQKMQEDMEALKADLEKREYVVKAGGGMVAVKIRGDRTIENIDIMPDIVDPEDIETLQDILVAAINEAIRTVEEDSAAEMQKITAGIDMPGMF